MKTAIALLGLLTAPILWAAEVPGIAPGDYLLVYAQIIECGSDPQAIEAAQVNGDGVLTLFGDASLVAAGKSVRQVRDELLDEMERRTGHRAKTLELVYVPGSDKEAAAKRLVRFSAEVERSCSRRVLPPSDIDENRVEAFGKLVSSDRGSARQPIATTRVGAIILEAA